MQVQLLTRPEPAASPAPGRLTRHDRARLALLLGWLLLLVAVLAFGERHVTVSRLDADVSSGQVRTLGVSPALPGTGNMVQEVHWREGWRRYVVRVDQVTPGLRVSNPLPVVHEDMAARLQAEQPGLRVVRIPDASLSDVAMLGRNVPQWVDHVRLVLGLLAVMLLVGGPRPWRASRWAWFWLVVASGLPTYGIVAFLLLSGRTPLVSAPRPGTRRLTGGWALLVALLVRAAVGSG